MRKTVFIDTNFLYGLGSNLDQIEEYIKSKQLDFDIITSELVLIEYASKIIRSQNKYIGGLTDFLYSLAINKVLSFSNKSISKETIRKTLTKTIIDKLRAIFDGGIYPYQKDNLFDIVLSRDKEKLPPFLNESDKGFKDSVIWLSFLDSVKEIKSSELYFISSDNGFANNVSSLQKEFKSLYKDKTLTVMKKFPLKPKTIFEGDTTDNSEVRVLPENISEFRIKASSIASQLSGCQDYDQFGNEYQMENFTTYERFSSDGMKKFIIGISKFLYTHPFNDTFSAFELFKDYPIQPKYNISSDILTELYSFYDGLETMHLKQSFIDYITSYINTHNYTEPKASVPHIEVSEDDLPF